MRHITCFGEHILYHKKRNIAKIGKAECEWYDGVYLGMSGLSSYILVGTSQGIETTTSFRRQPEGIQWNKLIDAITTTREQRPIVAANVAQQQCQRRSSAATPAEQHRRRLA